MPHELTQEQEAIIEATTGRQSLMVNAGAGCGKSSTLALAASRVRVPALSLTFARTNTEDLRRSLPGNWTVRSFNGLGHAAWARSGACGATQVRLDERKLGKLVSEVSREWKAQLVGDQWAQVKDLAGKAMMEGLVPQGQEWNGEAGLREDTPADWQEMAEDQGVPAGDITLVSELAREVLCRSIGLARQGILSYDDQIYCSVLLGGQFPQFPFLAVDEDQDLSPLQIAMVGKALRAGGRLMCVGDRAQACYAWRGASGNAEQLLRWLKPLDEWLDLPLMTSFRVPGRVADRQQDHVPGFQAHAGNPRGLVEDWRGEYKGQITHWDWSIVRDALSELKNGAQVAVLCRNNAPLVAMAFRLLRQGLGCQMLGRDIGAQAAGMMKRLCPRDEMPAQACREAIKAHMQSEASALLANGHEDRIEALEDRCGVLLAVLDSTEATTAGAMRVLLAKLFDSKGQVTLSSIHRAKGREWDLVIRLDPWRGQRRAQGETRSPVELGQELNLAYVAETRTRHTLVLANSEEFK
jgi:hypothetical protein